MPTLSPRLWICARLEAKCAAFDRALAFYEAAHEVIVRLHKQLRLEQEQHQRTLRLAMERADEIERLKQ
ncbi:MAG: hypothetical protein WCS94_14140 [Verrucomicrobiota bacterium]